MTTLYYSPGACSMAIHVLLNALDIPFKAEKISLAEGQNKTEAFLKINPRGQVPVLVDGDVTLREGAAIILYLLEKHPSPLLPASGKERTLALEWLMYGNASLHPAYSRLFFLNRAAQDEAAKAQLVEVATGMLSKMWADVEAQLEKTPYLAGNSLTIGDILVTVIANWGGWLSLQPVIGAKTKALLAKVSAHPAYQKALQAEQVEYKAAA